MKSAKKTILCKSEQRGKFLVSLITFIALSQEELLIIKKITSTEIKLLSVRGRFKLVRGLFIDSESTEQIYIVGEVNFDSL